MPISYDQSVSIYNTLFQIFTDYLLLILVFLLFATLFIAALYIRRGDNFCNLHYAISGTASLLVILMILGIGIMVMGICVMPSGLIAPINENKIDDIAFQFTATELSNTNGSDINKSSRLISFEVTNMSVHCQDPNNGNLGQFSLALGIIGLGLAITMAGCTLLLNLINQFLL